MVWQPPKMKQGIYGFICLPLFATQAGLTAINHFFDIAHLIMATEFVALAMKQTLSGLHNLISKIKTNFMSNEKLLGEDLLQLQNEKGNICVSVIVPTHRMMPERRGDNLEVEKALEKARQLLRYKYSEVQAKPLIRYMDELFASIDFTHNMEGIGLYISSNTRLAVQFPFPVQEKVMVDDNFEIRDLLYKISYAIPYYVLMLAEKGGRLFEGQWKDLAEIKDNNWPMEYKDEYVYEKPVRSSSYAGHSHVKSYEKDKSELEAIRFKDFFHKVDKTLNPYLTDNISLVLLGSEKELAWFEDVSKHKRNIRGKIAGSYNHSNSALLAEITWPVMLAYLEDERQQLVKEFREKIGARLAISGIQEIWKAAGEGRAFKLLVEKDFRCPGFVVENDPHLYLRPLQEPHKILADAVDELIETVLEKGGHVCFTGSDALNDYGHVALITRY